MRGCGEIAHMYESLTDIPMCIRQIHRWIWLAMPDDAAQEYRLSLIEHPALTDVQRVRLISYRLRELARTCWRRAPQRRTPAIRTILPSRLAGRDGNTTHYRTDPDRHRAARNKVSPERRAQIARMGAAARKARKEK